MKKEKVLNTVLWTDGDIVVAAWLYNYAVPKQVLEHQNAVNLILSADTAGMVFCTKCASLVKKSDIALKHFNSAFCATCAEKYKQDNSKVCRVCGSEHWRCVC